MGRFLVSAAACGLLLLGFASSCAHVEKAPDKEAKAPIFVTRGPLGTEITWKSKPGYTYSVLWRFDRPGDQWKPLPNASGLRGTGEDLAVKAPPERGAKRKYHVQVFRGDGARAR